MSPIQFLSFVLLKIIVVNNNAETMDTDKLTSQYVDIIEPLTHATDSFGIYFKRNICSP